MFTGNQSLLFTCWALSRAHWFPDSDLSSMQFMCADRDWVVLAKLTMLKYVHVLLRAPQCESVNAQSCVCGAGIFLPLISRAAGLGCCLLCLDKDAVCGPLLGACVAACVHRPDPPLEGVGGVFGVIFIRSLPQFNLANTGISLSCFYGWMLIPTINLHLVRKLRGFLMGTFLFCIVLLPCHKYVHLWTLLHEKGCIPTMFVIS